MGVSDDRLAQLIDDPAACLGDSDPTVRRLAVSGCARRVSEAGVAEAIARLLEGDPDGRVRAECAEVLGGAGVDMVPALLRATDDPDPRVVEAVATALGAQRATGDALAWLLDAAAGHDDKLVREAAVAALGEVGDATAIDLLLGLVAQAPPQVRRRAVVALTVFDDDRIEPAIRRAAHDRNPMVREAAEMVVGHQPPDMQRQEP